MNVYLKQMLRKKESIMLEERAEIKPGGGGQF